MTYFSLHSNHCSWFCRNKKAQLISPKWSRKFDDFAMISELFAVIQLSRMSLNWFLELFFSSCELDWGCSSDSEFDRWSCRVNFSLEAISQLDTWIMKVNANFQKKTFLRLSLPNSANPIAKSDAKFQYLYFLCVWRFQFISLFLFSLFSRRPSSPLALEKRAQLMARVRWKKLSNKRVRKV